MHLTIDIDDDLLAEGKRYTGIKDTAAVVHQALVTLVQREAPRRLAAFGGSQPGLRPIPRRRPTARRG